MPKTVAIEVDHVRSTIHHLEQLRAAIARNGRMSREEKISAFNRIKACWDVMTPLLQPSLPMF